ncbi:FtsW/RodA/SpoVE family cell cycle protein [Patescibacteria group bacterium]
MKNNKIFANKSFFILIFSLLVFGLFIIYNSTAYFSQSTFGNPFRFVILQLVWIGVGLVGFSIFSNLDYKKLKSISFLLFITSIVLLVILGFVGTFFCKSPDDTGTIFAPCLNGASRWFYINPKPLPELPFFGVIGLQPSELAKLTIILYLAAQLSKFENKKGKNLDPFVVYIVTSLLFAFLLLLQPNMSTAVLVFMIGSVIYWVSGYSSLPLLIATPIMGILGVLLMFTSDYRRARLLTLLGVTPEVDYEAGYHIKQIMIALGSGGFFGLGFGQSRQKYQYLPEVASDSIFAIIGEEFGFVGTTVVILAFGYLIYLGYNIAQKAPDKLGRMLAAGITSWIGLQFFINVAAMTKLIPLTGMPIPLISYGGSSMVFTLIGLGVLRNIQKQVEA